MREGLSASVTGKTGTPLFGQRPGFFVSVRALVTSCPAAEVCRWIPAPPVVESAVAVQEEDRDIRQEDVPARELRALVHQFAQQDVADHVVALLADVLFAYFVEMQYVVYVGLLIADVNLQRDVGRVPGFLT